MSMSHWAVTDSGSTWVPAEEFLPREAGHELRMAAGKGFPLGGMVLNAGAAVENAEFGGLGLEGGVTLTPRTRRKTFWQVGLARVNRAPRSDELLTPLRRNIDGQEILIFANQDLDRESAWEMSALGQLRLLGFDLALDASHRRLKDGISWQAVADTEDQGRWQNGLDMNSSRLTGSLGRQGRFLGWVRLKLEGTWQTFDPTQGTAAFLPPEEYIRFHLMWENHFFKEDGILQVALLSTRRGEMADPWDPRGAFLLPAATWHDLIVGFRLVGAHLSLAMRNLTSTEMLTSAGTKAPSQEMDMRLHWVFHY
jgi:hypothetical protein